MDKNTIKGLWSWYKAGNLALLIFLALFILYIPIFMEQEGCAEASWCTFEIRSGTIEPLHASLQYFIYLPLVLLFLPSRYFRRWLWYVASWGIPLSVLLVSTTSVHSSGIVGGRTTDAILTTVGFMILSAVVVLLFVAYDLWCWYSARSGADGVGQHRSKE